MFLHQLNHFLPRNYIWSGVESFAKTMTNTLSETNYEKLCLKVQAEGIYFSCITRCIKILHDAKNVLTFSEKQLHNMKYQNPAWVPKWIDIHRQTLSLRFETEWKVLLKQRQMIGLRQTEKSCLALHAELRFLSCTIWSIKILLESQNRLIFSDKHYLYGLKWSGKFCWKKDKRLVWDKLKNRASRFTLSQLHG